MMGWACLNAYVAEIKGELANSLDLTHTAKYAKLRIFTTEAGFDRASADAQLAAKTQSRYSATMPRTARLPHSRSLRQRRYRPWSIILPWCRISAARRKGSFSGLFVLALAEARSASGDFRLGHLASRHECADAPFRQLRARGPHALAEL